jgi:lactoylglutathione lyase
MRYLHTMIRVQDLDASLKFFCNGLGLVEVMRNDYESGRFSLIFLAAPEDVEMAKTKKAPMLELTYNWPAENGESETYSGGRNFGHLAYRVENIYKTCEHLQSMGVEILRPPRDGHMAFVKSPDGISIELLQEGESLAPSEPWLSMPNTGSW